MEGEVMKCLSLFSGIGGLDLAAERSGITPVAFCEIEEYPAKIPNRWCPAEKKWVCHLPVH